VQKREVVVEEEEERLMRLVRILEDDLYPSHANK
jgi:hypothetical protein